MTQCSTLFSLDVQPHVVYVLSSNPSVTGTPYPISHIILLFISDLIIYFSITNQLHHFTHNSMVSHHSSVQLNFFAYFPIFISTGLRFTVIGEKGDQIASERTSTGVITFSSPSHQSVTVVIRPAAGSFICGAEGFTVHVAERKSETLPSSDYPRFYCFALSFSLL